jgi:hypothetical protein
LSINGAQEAELNEMRNASEFGQLNAFELLPHYHVNRVSFTKPLVVTHGPKPLLSWAEITE